MRHGSLRIYLGAAPGVGKTFAMLDEGNRRAARGTDVLIGLVEDHGRPRTCEAIGDLEVLPRRTIVHRGAVFEELDLDALLARHPQVALVDELAHSNVPGSRNEKRWQDIEELLSAGIDVISTVNVQHLESLSDVVQRVTGITQRETVPDEVVRRADQIELVDMSPEALRRRMAHGNIYAPDKIDAALGHYFRVGNLTALRELALLWLADKVDEGLQAYRQAHGISGTWETRERIVVALDGRPEGDALIRRAARIASRQTGGDLLAAHVARNDGLQRSGADTLAHQRSLVESLGGSYHVLSGDDVAGTLLDFARAENATQLVLGASRRGRIAALFGPSVAAAVAGGSGSIDVHLVTSSRVGGGIRLPVLTGGLTARRRAEGGVLALVLLPLLTTALTATRTQFALTSQLLLYLSAVVAVALVGGIYPALAAAVAAVLLANYFFTPPYYTFTIAEAQNLLALGVFVLVAIAVSIVVDQAARRTRDAARSRAEAEALATLSGDVLRGERTMTAVLSRTRELFGFESVRMIETVDSGDVEVGSSGEASTADAASEVTLIPVTATIRLELRGRPPAAGDRRVIGAFAAQAAASLERHRLAEQAAAAQTLAEVDLLRTSLLAAVGHDLRTPLAAALASVTSLRGTDVDWTAAENDELLATAEESLLQLDGVVSNLLDMSRVQAGALAVHIERVALDEVLPLAIAAVADSGVTVDVPDTLPEVLVDAGLLERVVVNLLQNALRYGGDAGVRLAGSHHHDRVELRVVDRGPGVPDEEKERVFAPFQRLDDRTSSTSGAGVGLGLAVARAFVDAMGGELSADDTPGGGLTMTISLRAAP